MQVEEVEKRKKMGGKCKYMAGSADRHPSLAIENLF